MKSLKWIPCKNGSDGLSYSERVKIVLKRIGERRKEKEVS